MRFRVDASGASIVLPEAEEYRVVAGSALDGRDSRLLEDIGDDDAVAFHTDAYGEILPEDEQWEPGALLPIDACWAVIEDERGRTGVACTAPTLTEEAIETRYVAVLSSSLQYALVDGWETAPRITSGRIARAGRGWSGPSFRISPHPLGTSRSRDWIWAGTMPWEGLVLEINCAAFAPAIHDWLAKHAPLPYVRTRDERYEESLREDYRSFFVVFDGMLRFCRHSFASDAIVGIDAGLLDEVARGALGEVSWRLICGDWGTTYALGESTESLAEYLAGREPRST